MIECCLSLPEVQVNITRSDRLLVVGYDLKGEKRQLECTGLLARVIQHELDHLDGALICDYGQNVKRRDCLNNVQTGVV
jgi:peptide deformylase